MQHTSDPKAANVNIPAQQPSGKLYLNALQAGIPGDGLYHQILLDTIMANFTDGIEDTVNHIITPGVAGYYQVNASMKVDHPVVGEIYCLHVLRNVGGNLILQGMGHASSAANNLIVNCSDVLYLTNIHFLEMGIVHWVAAGESVTVSYYSTFLSVQRVR